MLRPMRQIKHRPTVRQKRIRPRRHPNQRAESPRTRDDSKQAKLIEMLQPGKGATIDEIAEAVRRGSPTLCAVRSRAR